MFTVQIQAEAFQCTHLLPELRVYKYCGARVPMQLAPPNLLALFCGEQPVAIESTSPLALKYHICLAEINLVSGSYADGKALAAVLLYNVLLEGKFSAPLYGTCVLLTTRSPDRRPDADHPLRLAQVDASRVYLLDVRQWK